MCMSSPDIPAPPPPPQEVKQPDTINTAQRKQNRAGGMTSGTLLTGPSGAAPAPTGRATLLGQ